MIALISHYGSYSLGEFFQRVLREGDGNAYTESTPAMVALFDVLAPAGGHLPFMLRSTLRTDQIVCDFDFGIGVCHLEKLVYAADDFADVGVALSRSSIVFGDRDLENRDYDSVVVEIVVDGKRVKEGSLVAVGT